MKKRLGIVAIDYNYANQTYGDIYPYWLLPEEIESVEWKDDNNG